MQAYFESSMGKNTIERNVQHCAGCAPPDMNVRVVLTDIHGNSFIGKRTVHAVFGEMYQHQNTLIPPKEIKYWINLPVN